MNINTVCNKYQIEHAWVHKQHPNNVKHDVRETHGRMCHFSRGRPRLQPPGKWQHSSASVDRGPRLSPLVLKGLSHIRQNASEVAQLRGTLQMDPLDLSRCHTCLWTRVCLLEGGRDTGHHIRSDISHPFQPRPSPWRRLPLTLPVPLLGEQSHRLGCCCSCHRDLAVCLGKRMAFLL